MIIDASVAFKWVVDEEGSDRALALIGRDPLDAPSLIHAEVGNALWKRIGRGQLTSEDEPAAHLASVAQIVHTSDETHLLPRALEMALRLNHPIYDCIYLAMAEAYERTLITADLRFLSMLNGSPFKTMVVAL